MTLLLVSGGIAYAETPYISAKASNINDTSAKLTGSVGGTPDDSDVDSGPYYYFEYGTTSSVNSTTPETDDLDGLTLYAEITDLEPDTKYYYRFVEKVDYEDDNEGYIYEKSPLRTFKTFEENYDIEENENELTDAQIEGLDDLGFTDRQIKMIVALFAKKDHDGPKGLACGYRHKMLLRLGMFGDDVREIQKALKLNADGKFGRLTKEAVMRFQAEHGLPADGIIGTKTGLKLGILCNSEQD